MISRSNSDAASAAASSRLAPASASSASSASAAANMALVLPDSEAEPLPPRRRPRRRRRLSLARRTRSAGNRTATSSTSSSSAMGQQQHTTAQSAAACPAASPPHPGRGPRSRPASFSSPPTRPEPPSRICRSPPGPSTRRSRSLAARAHRGRPRCSRIGYVEEEGGWCGAMRRRRRWRGWRGVKRRGEEEKIKPQFSTAALTRPAVIPSFFLLWLNRCQNAGTQPREKGARRRRRPGSIGCATPLRRDAIRRGEVDGNSRDALSGSSRACGLWRGRREQPRRRVGLLPCVWTVEWSSGRSFRPTALFG